MTVASDDTIDAMMGGRFRVVQSRRGHRAGLDAMLLAASVPADAQGHLIDLGAGCGTVAFAALTRAPGLTATLIERDAADCDRAERGLALNPHLNGRITILCGDVAAIPANGRASYVLANPPYNEGRHQSSPDARRAEAHDGNREQLESWFAAACRWTMPGGTAAFIFRPDWWVEAGRLAGFGDRRLLPIAPRVTEAATRIIITAKRSRATPASILPPLIVHEADGTFTPHVEAVLRGEVGLFDRMP